MLNMVNGSIQSELSRFFEIIKNDIATLDDVTTAAFCKARKKISYNAFKALNSCLTETFYQSAHVKHWNNFRLLAVDSSVTALHYSDELMNHFGKAREHASFPSARLSQLYDITNKLTVDLQVGLHSTGERKMALSHLEHAKENDLVLYDRGYPAAWLFALHQQNNIHFCARASVDFSIQVRDFIKSGEKDALIEMNVEQKSLSKCRELGLPTKSVPCRFISIRLPCGEIEVLITSLTDKKQFPYKVFPDLYNNRWFIEEDYKLMKSRLEIENFTGYSVEAIKQDIHAKILTKNIAAIAIHDTAILKKQKYKNRKFEYRINFTYTLSQLKNKIVLLLLQMHSDNLCSAIVSQITKNVNAFRPGRKTDRPYRKVRRKRFPPAYKSVR